MDGGRMLLGARMEHGGNQGELLFDVGMLDGWREE
jgi:hypothetical protein